MTTPANQALSPHFGGIAPPTNPDGAGWALFLDFDGTLIDIAMTPDAVVVPSTLRAVLPACIDAFAGAVAIVSGRPISTLDALLGPLRLPAAGLHGLELRLPDGTVEETAHRPRGSPSCARGFIRSFERTRGSSSRTRAPRWRYTSGARRSASGSCAGSSPGRRHRTTAIR